MFNLIDFLNFCGLHINIENFKIHLASGSIQNSPLEAFYNNTFKEWQEWQTKRNFQCDMIISLIHIGSDKWLFAGVYKILDYNKISEDHFDYSTQLLQGQDEIIGRLIVKHRRQGRASYLWGKSISNQFRIVEIKEKRLTVEEFPGYNNVSISFSKLQTIISQNIQSWRGALANIKGVYVITDTKTGKLYIGSATGQDGIWDRWSQYSINGHGGNKELISLLKDHSLGYQKYFQFSIIEIADFNISDDNLLSREQHWKNVFKTREFGYNSN